MLETNVRMTYLILRIGSIGNVAMTVPVISSAAQSHKDDIFVIVSGKRLSDMFYGLKNVRFHTADFTGKRNRYKDVFLLFRELRRKYKADAVLDLQNNLKTRILRLLFKATGIKTYTTDNELRQKRQLRWHGYKHSQPLKSEFERYADVFAQAGIATDNSFTAIEVNQRARATVLSRTGQKKGRWIGVAPFAKSRTNMLPFRTTKELLSRLSSETDTRLFLFGAGEVECAMLSQWAGLFTNTTCVAGSLSLAEVCMDSANQHLASLVETRVVSVWCGTHPYTGFYAWKQSPDDCLQTTLSCRPCTNHGRQYCKFYNFLCQDIKVEEITEKLIN